MVEASAALAGNSVILSCLGDQIQNLALLHSLCLVNRQFNVEFSPFLYRHVEIRDGPGLRSLVNPSGCLRYAKEISFSGELTANEANETFRRILPSMKRLEAVNWVEVPLATQTLAALQAAPQHIRKLRIEYAEDTTWCLLGLGVAPGEDDKADAVSKENRSLYRSQDLSGFSGLEELTVHNIHDDISRWTRRLARVLAQSPGLRKLSLSLAVDAVARAAHRERHDDYWGFFEELAREYAETSPFSNHSRHHNRRHKNHKPNAPLPLRKLHCGPGVFPMDESRLRQLVNLSTLERVHIENVDVARDVAYLEIYDGVEDRSGIAFGAFLNPTTCPRLRCFSAAALMPDVWEALCAVNDGGFARRLAVSFRRQEVGYLELVPLLLPLQRRKRKELKEHEEIVHDIVHDESESDAEEDSYGSCLPLPLRMVDLELCRDAAVSDFSVDTVLDALVDSCSASLEGLAAHIPGVPETEKQVEVLCSLMDALVQLPHLTQLVVRTERRYSTPPPGVSLAIATELAGEAPRLRYVRVDDEAWQVSRVNRSSGGDGIWLRELDGREQGCVELFAHTVFDPDP
ncbi:hypothetical protein PG988_014216 [Apiospora saccharicola]